MSADTLPPPLSFEEAYSRMIDGGSVYGEEQMWAALAAKPPDAPRPESPAVLAEAVLGAIYAEQLNAPKGEPDEAYNRAIEDAYEAARRVFRAALQSLPAGPQFLGMPVVVDPSMAPDSIRLVDPAGSPSSAVQRPAGGDDQFRGAAIGWAMDRWDAEVKHRPIVNIHRRSLDDAWRQVIRHFGGDPDALLGPCHDELRSNVSAKDFLEQRAKQDEKTTPANPGSST